MVTQQQTVVVIDDARDVRDLLSHVVARAGYRVVAATSGEEGLALLENETPSLICVDYMMPGIDGAEVVRRVRQMPRIAQTPVIVLTASSEEHTIEMAFAAGADDYITKPFDRRIVLARIASSIRAAEDRVKVANSSRLVEQRDALLHDLEEAARVQRSMVTQLPRSFEDWTIMGAMIPCNHIGGDTLSIVDTPSGVAAAVVDVSGHGAGAALVASALTAELRQLAAVHPLTECLQRMNTRMTTSQTDYYACIGIVQLTNAGALVVNAGLPPIGLISGGAIVNRIEASGVPPGLLANSSYSAVELVLKPGERIVMISDGLSEPLGDADSIEPCYHKLELLHPSGIRSSEDFGRAIRTLFNGAPLADDASILVLDRW